MMTKFKITLFLLVFCFTILAFAQKPVTVVFRYNPDSLKKDSFYLSLKRPFDLQSFGQYHDYPEKVVSVSHHKNYTETICQYNVTDTTCAYLSTGFGYKTFIIPGDTLMVNINSNDKPAVKIQGKYARPWFHDISIEGKNRFTYALFDSLANVGGVLGWSGDVAYSQAKDLPGFCKLVNDRYKVRLLFLEKYSSEHHIANTYVNLAKAEIYASFINNLLRPLFTRGIDLHSYPSPYQGILLTSRFADPSLYFKTSVYGQTAYLHTSSISRQNTGAKPFDDHDLISIYDLIKKSYPDTIKNHLLTVHLSTFLGNPNLIYPSFDSLLTDFKAVCKNNLYIRFLDSSFTVKKSQIFKKYTLEEAMSSRMKDTNGSAITVKTVFKSRPVLIICWASWCGPCIREMPFEKKFQEQFKGKVDFIYLSFDKNKGAWEGKSKELNMDLNNYLLTNYFTSDFAKFYQISSLPFYLLYDKQGQKVELNNLRPSEATFADILKKLAN